MPEVIQSGEARHSHSVSTFIQMILLLLSKIYSELNLKNGYYELQLKHFILNFHTNKNTFFC